MNKSSRNSRRKMSLTNLVYSLPKELQFEILLYLNDYINNLFIYIYDIKKQTTMFLIVYFIKIKSHEIIYKKK
jgi:hypothetical protein